MLPQPTIVDRVERAVEARPFCACGRHTMAVWRDGTVWLECASLSEPRTGLLGRLAAAVTDPMHVRDCIVEAPASYDNGADVAPPHIHPVPSPTR
jgi:hypothetical protein